jgi:hypothetical protein
MAIVRIKGKTITADKLTEEQFLNQIVDLAHLYGWKAAHFRGVRVQRANGTVFYQTPVQADGKGFPDLVLIKPGHPVIFAELKAKGGKLSPEQIDWLETLTQTKDIQVGIWYPEDFDVIHGILSGGESDG